MSGPYQGRNLSNCGVGRLRVAFNCGVLSVKQSFQEYSWKIYYMSELLQQDMLLSVDLKNK